MKVLPKFKIKSMVFFKSMILHCMLILSHRQPKQMILQVHDCWPAVQGAITVLQLPLLNFMICRKVERYVIVQ